jgi:hypothetical protein
VGEAPRLAMGRLRVHIAAANNSFAYCGAHVGSDNQGPIGTDTGWPLCATCERLAPKHTAYREATL